jgi:hypothetical protein
MVQKWSVHPVSAMILDVAGGQGGARSVTDDKAVGWLTFSFTLLVFSFFAMTGFPPSYSIVGNGPLTKSAGIPQR